jgi:hypothetical protein
VTGWRASTEAEGTARARHSLFISPRRPADATGRSVAAQALGGVEGESAGHAARFCRIPVPTPCRGPRYHPQGVPEVVPQHRVRRDHGQWPPGPKKMACGAVSLRRYCPDQVPGGRRSAAQLSGLSALPPGSGSPRPPFGPAPSITSQTIFMLHAADDGRPEPKAPACTGQTSWLRRSLRQRSGPCTGALRRSRPPAADPTPAGPMESICLELHVSRSTLYRAMARLNGKEGARHEHRQRAGRAGGRPRQAC